jgi:hypothetical protein
MKAVDPSTFEVPSKRAKEYECQNFVAQNWRGEFRWGFRIGLLAFFISTLVVAG